MVVDFMLSSFGDGDALDLLRGFLAMQIAFSSCLKSVRESTGPEERAKWAVSERAIIDEAIRILRSRRAPDLFGFEKSYDA